MAISPVLVEALRDAQRLGLFGDRPIEDAIEHSLAFVGAVVPVVGGARIIDLGSGGGLPGLVLAHELPHAVVELLDRRQKRTDFLERVVRRLDWAHVSVRCEDARSVVRRVRQHEVAPYDVVTARGFGPPERTLTIAADLIGPRGRIVISEPPSGDRWDPALVRSLGLTSTRHGAVRRFER